MHEESATVLDLLREEVVKCLVSMSGLEILQAQSMVEDRWTEDFEFSVTMQKAVKFGLENLDHLAEQWVSKFVSNEYVEKVSILNVGEGKRKITYIMFRCFREKLIRLTLQTVYRQGDKYGASDLWKGKTVAIDYSSPNIAKPFHAGHLRSTIIGNFLRNMYEFFGAKTVSINYLGDWGTQYGILAVGFEEFGSYELLEKSPIKHLFDIYVKASKIIAGETDAEGNQITPPNPEFRARACEYFKRMELGDQNLLQLWKKFREYSIIEYQQIYKRLNIKFDVYSGESEMNDLIDDTVKKLDDRHLLLTAPNGAKYVDLTKYNLNKVSIKKGDNASLYVTRDLVAAYKRHCAYDFDLMIYVVATQQDLYLMQLFKLLQLMGYEWYNKLIHINFGIVMGMKTRTGNVVFLENILNAAKEKMLKKMKEDVKGKLSEIEDIESTADILGVSAVIVQDLSSRRIKNYTFNLEHVTSIEGNTGPYLQYTHSRLCSMMDKNSNVPLTDHFDPSLLHEDIAHQLVLQIARFPLILKSTLFNHESSTLVNYMFELTRSISLAHSLLIVKNAEPNLAIARKLLFWSSKSVLCNSLKLLGLVPLKRM